MSDQALKEGRILPVMEHFYTVQGEGCHSGRPAYFIRLGGCDVGCHWCDVKESWDADAHPKMNVKQIVSEVLQTKADFVVVTGGEPTMYNLLPLTEALEKYNIELAIETSGTNELTGSWHWVCFSPKKFKDPVESIYEHASELKVVIHNEHDLEWAEMHADKINEDALLYLQPEWGRQEEMTAKIVDYVKENPHWIISLQTHKYMNIP